LGLPSQILKNGEGESLLVESEKTDCIVEVQGTGHLSVQFGVDMEELRTLLGGDTTEDIAEDELQRVARDHLRPVCNKFRSKLLAQGFEESLDAAKEYYAICFVKPLDSGNEGGVVSELQGCLKLLS